MAGGTPSTLKRFQVPVFFVLAYALSWLVWATYPAQQSGLISFHLPEGFFAYFSLTAAAFLVAGLSGGRAAVMDLVQRILRWRAGVRWYALALLVPVLLSLAGYGVYRLLGGRVALGAQLPLGAAVAYFILFGAKLWVTEEVAWRGFALPRLQAGRSALWASVILGLLWGAWHTPLFFIPEFAQSNYPYVGFLVFAVAESILTTWIFNSTGGSVLLPTVFHAATDASLAFIGLGTDALLFWVAVAVTWVAAIGVILAYGPALLARVEPAQRDEIVAPGFVPPRLS